jgi:hypothetical protein
MKVSFWSGKTSLNFLSNLKEFWKVKLLLFINNRQNVFSLCRFLINSKRFSERVHIFLKELFCVQFFVGNIASTDQDIHCVHFVWLFSRHQFWAVSTDDTTFPRWACIYTIQLSFVLLPWHRNCPFHSSTVSELPDWPDGLPKWHQPCDLSLYYQPSHQRPMCEPTQQCIRQCAPPNQYSHNIVDQ